MRAVLDYSPIGVSVFAVKDWRRLYANRAQLDMMGAESGSVFLETDISASWVRKEDFEFASRQVLTETGLVDFEAERIRFNDGCHRWIAHDSQKIVFEGQASVILWCRDVTSRRMAENERRNNEAKYREAATLAKLGHWVWDDISDCCVWCSDEIARMHGVSVAEYITLTSSRKADTTWVHPEDRDFYRQTLDKAARELTRYDIEFRIVGRDGIVRNVREISSPEKVENGTLIRSSGIMQDITAMRRVEAALAERENQLRLALDNMPCGIIMVDRDRSVRAANQNFIDLLKLPQELVTVGNPLMAIIRFRASRGDYGPGNPDQLIRERLAGWYSEKATTFEDQATGGRQLEVARMPIDTGEVVSIVFDITDRKKEEHDKQLTNERLERQVFELMDNEERLETQASELISLAEDLSRVRDELKKLNDQKDNFFSIIAHDLKSPFNAMLGFSELLASGAGNMSAQQIEEYSALVHQSADQAFKLLEDLLDWARLQLGGIELNQQALDINKIIKNNIERYRPAATLKGISLESRGADLVKVFADPQMTDTVLRNLISNALKFTQRAGSVTVSVRCATDIAEVSISDTGVGIATSKIRHLFQIGDKVSTPGTDGESGTGLGLLMCREMVEKQGGEIVVESQKGQGSTFRFTLPLYVDKPSMTKRSE